MSPQNLGGFLEEMVASSAERARKLSHREDELRGLAKLQAPALRPQLSGFDVIAEVKLTSPSEGALDNGGEQDIAGRVRDYAAAGAAAISVLTEPTRFGGHLEHLRLAATCAHEFGVPVMRKDFPVDPLQILEARAHGADGVLLIARIVSNAILVAQLTEAHNLGLFVLLEAFDGPDLDRIKAVLSDHLGLAGNLLVGVNARDLTTLKVDKERQLALASQLPREQVCVAESGILTAADAAQAASVGYGLVLVGTALMRASQASLLLAELRAAGQAVAAGRRNSEVVR